MAFKRVSRSKYIYENGGQYKEENDVGMSYARVLSVSADNRNCEIITFGAGLSDKYFPEAQIISMDTGREGDEFISIPRRGALCIVNILGCQAYILGFIRPNSVSGAPIWGNEIQLRQGDKLIGTKAGNRLTVRSNGLIEVLAVKGGLQTVWSPSDDSITELCSNKITTSSAGKESWEVDLETSLCRHRQLFKKDVAQTSVIIEERGHTAGFGLDGLVDPILYKQSMGTLPPGLSDIPITQFYREIDIFGVRKTYIGPTTAGITTGFEKIEDGFLGSLEYNIGVAKQVHLEADGLTGDTLLNLFKLINLEMTPSSGGGVILKTPLMSLEIEPSGGYKFTNGVGTLPGAEVSSLSVSPVGALTFKNNIAEASIAESGDISIKNKTVEIGVTATGDTSIISTSKAYAIEAKGSGEISATDQMKGALKIAQGKVALGGATAEVLDLFSQVLKEMDTLLTNMGAEKHIGNMGVPTTLAPDAVANYKSSQVALTAISKQLDAIKGSL